MEEVISQIEIYRSSVKLKAPFIISLGKLDAADNIIVVIRTKNGLTGFGECSPFMTINGESAATCFVVGGYFARLLLKKNPLNIAECADLMNACIYGNSSIKSAFDMALHDIAAQHAGLPLYSFLGGKNNKEIITDYTVSFDLPEKMADDAAKVIDNGFKILKVKLGGKIKDDHQRIALIRKVIGDSIPIRIDANQGWSADDAITVLNDLVHFNIQHCEEPIPRWDFMSLPRVRKNSPVKIMADESCCDHHDAQRLVDIYACDLFNIKLGKSSGIINANKIIEVATHAGMKLQLGGFLESRLGFTGAAHLALISGSIIHFDFDTPLMFNEDYVSGGIIYNDGGVITVPESPGLGATVDEKYLSRMEKIIFN